MRRISSSESGALPARATLGRGDPAHRLLSAELFRDDPRRGLRPGRAARQGARARTLDFRPAAGARGTAGAGPAGAAAVAGSTRQALAHGKDQGSPAQLLTDKKPWSMARKPPDDSPRR